MTKIALVNFGNEESYGLLFVAEELKKHGDIKFFDTLSETHIKDILDYKPNYICFSPMTTFINDALEIEKVVKSNDTNVVSLYGGHHVTNSNEQYGDLTIKGAIHGIDITKKGIINNGATNPINLVKPAREEYYRDIPRLRNRYRKVMLSVVGCPFSCTYCSSSVRNTKKVYDDISCMLKRRNMEDIINEAKYIKDCTEEIEWVDDDIFCGDIKWLDTFLDRWINEIGLPMYVSTTSISALKVSDEILKKLRKVVNCIGMGVQATNPESLKLLGRSWDNKEQLKKAYNRLTSFGFKVNLQCIIGLPVVNTIEDAIETIEGMKYIGQGCIASCYPLQIYPNTEIESYCKEHGYRFNYSCNGDTNSGMPGIDFGDITNRRIMNLCKLATMIIKYGIDKKWYIPLLDADFNNCSERLSQTRYFECIKDRLPNNAESIFQTIISGMKLRY